MRQNTTSPTKTRRNQAGADAQADAWLAQKGYGADGEPLTPTTTRSSSQRSRDPARSGEFEAVGGGFKRHAHRDDGSMSQRDLVLMAASASRCGDSLDAIFEGGIPTGRDLPADLLVAEAFR